MSVLLTACRRSRLIAKTTKIKRAKKEEQPQQCIEAGAAARMQEDEVEAKEWKFYWDEEFFCLMFYPSHGEVYLNGLPLTPIREGRHLSFCVGVSKARISLEGPDVVLTLDGEIVK